MATKVDICNQALRYLGEAGTMASIDPEETSTEAELCSRMYPVCRDLMLEDFPWSFAIRRVALAVGATDVYGWGYAYRLPSDLMRILAISEADDRMFENPQQFIIESDESGLVCYTDTANAVIRYVRTNVPETMMPESFCDALAYLLASKLAGQIIKGTSAINVQKNLYAFYAQALEKAKSADAAQQRTFTVPEGILKSGGYRG